MKHKKILKFALGFILLFLVSLSYAGTDPCAFLKTGVGARALGMGGAFVSIADDATCTYWNPAGLALINRPTLGTMIQSLGSPEWESLRDIAPTYQFLNFIIPTNNLGLNKWGGSFGISWIHTGIDNIPHTYLDESGNIVRDSFNDSEDAYFISYGSSILENQFLIGGNLKILRQSFTKIPDANATGWDLDAGMIYSISDRNNIGLLLQKGVTLKWANGHVDKGPLTAKAGTSYKFVNKERLQCLAACDLLQAKSHPLEGHFGGELNYIPQPVKLSANDLSLNKISFRCGIDGIVLENRYGNIDQMNNHTNWTLGLGLNFNILNQGLQIDYNFGSYRLGDKHRLSFILEIL